MLNITYNKCWKVEVSQGTLRQTAYKAFDLMRIYYGIESISSPHNKKQILDTPNLCTIKKSSAP